MSFVNTVPRHLVQDIPAIVETHEVGPTTSTSQNMDKPHLADIKSLMAEIFDGHRLELKHYPRSGTPALTVNESLCLIAYNADVELHNAQIDSLIESRATKLQEIGQTPSDIQAILKKAAMLDRIATTAASAIRAVPFAAASVLQYMKPQINEGAWMSNGLRPLTPFIPGALSGVMDAVGTGVMNQMTGNAHYLKVCPDQLHDALKRSLVKNDPGTLQKVVDHSFGLQGYSVRNAVRAGVGTVMEHAAPSAKSAVDMSISAWGGVVANAVYGNRLHTADQRDLLRGAAFMFGRKDAKPRDGIADEIEWLQTYNTIMEAGLSSAAFNGVKRLAGLPIDVLTDSLSQIRNLATPITLGQSAVLSAGFAAVGTAQRALSALVSHPVAKEAISQSTNTLLSTGVFAAWGSLGLVITPAVDKVELFLRDDLKSAAAAFTKNGSEKSQSAVDKVVKFGVQGVDSAIATGAQLHRLYNNQIGRLRESSINAEGGTLTEATSAQPLPTGV